jgi:transcriptional regulator with XRE-family HTH domain
MTQSQLAAKIGCTQVNLSRWERGIHSPNSRWLPLLAAALNCSIDDISKED